jgi:hypothetical protein
MVLNVPRLVGAAVACGVALLSLAGCNGATPPEAGGQVNSLPAMQPGPTTVGPAGLGPAGQDSAVGSGNLASPGGAGLTGGGPPLH